LRYPNLVRIRQQFERPRVVDVAATVARTLESLNLGQRIRPGQSVALTAGSRGIANIPLILKATADFLKRLGAKPFIVPTMGSHGGGTAEGQRKILESYGITEAFTGIPIRASMQVEQVGTTAEGYPAFVDQHALSADHIGVVARIKPHTAFHGPIESGLLKMILIGLGKHQGALAYHRILMEAAYDGVVRSISRLVLAKAPIAFGLGIVENGYDETARIEAIAPPHFEWREEHLLEEARRLLGQLPILRPDVLIVDEIGKDISGAGMDTNVVGRKRAFRSQPAPEGLPAPRLIFVRGLSAHTHGNAAGIGLADFTTNRLVQAMDYQATVINCLTAGYPEGAFIPVHFETDREVLEAALAIIGPREPHDARVVRVRNTLTLDELELSEPCLCEKDHQTTFSPISTPRTLTFDAGGNLPPL
jgi:hypothetical protein